MNDKELIIGSQRYITAALLTLCGGFLDAYTYFSRGGVFANAQTGNIIKFGINAALGQYEACVMYLVPILSFVLGIFLARITEVKMKNWRTRYIRRSVLAAETAVLLCVMLIPEKEEFNIIANTLVSFVCALQMETFRSFEGQPYATVVSTGNLRKAAEYFLDGIIRKDSSLLKISRRYFLIVLLFIAGAFSGTLITNVFHTYAVLVPASLLIICHIIISVRYAAIKAKENEQA